MKPYGRFVASGGSILLWRRCAIALGLIFAGANGCGKVVDPAQSFESFADWCENRTELSEAARHTVKVLLREAKTQDCQIADEQLTNLTELDLSGNQIADVGPLSTLTNLTALFLWNNRIADVGPLSTLTNLTELDLGGNRIADVEPLSGLTNLTALFLWNNRIADVEPLSGLTNLTALFLWNNRIADVGSLSTLTNLTELDLRENQIADRTCPVEPQSICHFE